MIKLSILYIKTTIGDIRNDVYRLAEGYYICGVERLQRNNGVFGPRRLAIVHYNGPSVELVTSPDIVPQAEFASRVNMLDMYYYSGVASFFDSLRFLFADLFRIFMYFTNFRGAHRYRTAWADPSSARLQGFVDQHGKLVKSFGSPWDMLQNDFVPLVTFHRTKAFGSSHLSYWSRFDHVENTFWFIEAMVPVVIFSFVVAVIYSLFAQEREWFDRLDSRFYSYFGTYLEDCWILVAWIIAVFFFVTKYPGMWFMDQLPSDNFVSLLDPLHSATYAKNKILWRSTEAFQNDEILRYSELFKDLTTLPRQLEPQKASDTIGSVWNLEKSWSRVIYLRQLQMDIKTGVGQWFGLTFPPLFDKDISIYHSFLDRSPNKSYSDWLSASHRNFWLSWDEIPLHVKKRLNEVALQNYFDAIAAYISTRHPNIYWPAVMRKNFEYYQLTKGPYSQWARLFGESKLPFENEDPIDYQRQIADRRWYDQRHPFRYNFRLMRSKLKHHIRMTKYYFNSIVQKWQLGLFASVHMSMLDGFTPIQFFNEYSRLRKLNKRVQQYKWITRSSQSYEKILGWYTGVLWAVYHSFWPGLPVYSSMSKVDPLYAKLYDLKNRKFLEPAGVRYQFFKGYFNTLSRLDRTRRSRDRILKPFKWGRDVKIWGRRLKFFLYNYTVKDHRRWKRSLKWELDATNALKRSYARRRANWGLKLRKWMFKPLWNENEKQFLEETKKFTREQLKRRLKRRKKRLKMRFSSPKGYYELPLFRRLRGSAPWDKKSFAWYRGQLADVVKPLPWSLPIATKRSPWVPPPLGPQFSESLRYELFGKHMLVRGRNRSRYVLKSIIPPRRSLNVDQPAWSSLWRNFFGFSYWQKLNREVNTYLEKTKTNGVCFYHFPMWQNKQLLKGLNRNLSLRSIAARRHRRYPLLASNFFPNSVWARTGFVKQGILFKNNNYAARKHLYMDKLNWRSIASSRTEFFGKSSQKFFYPMSNRQMFFTGDQFNIKNFFDPAVHGLGGFHRLLTSLRPRYRVDQLYEYSQRLWRDYFLSEAVRKNRVSILPPSLHPLFYHARDKKYMKDLGEWRIRRPNYIYIENFDTTIDRSAASMRLKEPKLTFTGILRSLDQYWLRIHTLRWNPLNWRLNRRGKLELNRNRLLHLKPIKPVKRSNPNSIRSITWRWLVGVLRFNDELKFAAPFINHRSFTALDLFAWAMRWQRSVLLPSDHRMSILRMQRLYKKSLPWFDINPLLSVASDTIPLMRLTRSRSRWRLVDSEFKRLQKLRHKKRASYRLVGHRSLPSYRRKNVFWSFKIKPRNFVLNIFKKKKKVKILKIIPKLSSSRTWGTAFFTNSLLSRLASAGLYSYKTSAFRQVQWRSQQLKMSKKIFDFKRFPLHLGSHAAWRAKNRKNFKTNKITRTHRIPRSTRFSLRSFKFNNSIFSSAFKHAEKNLRVGWQNKTLDFSAQFKSMFRPSFSFKSFVYRRFLQMRKRIGVIDALRYRRYAGFAAHKSVEVKRPFYRFFSNSNSFPFLNFILSFTGQRSQLGQYITKRFGFRKLKNPDKFFLARKKLLRRNARLFGFKWPGRKSKVLALTPNKKVILDGTVDVLKGKSLRHIKKPNRKFKAYRNWAGFNRFQFFRASKNIFSKVPGVMWLWDQPHSRWFYNGVSRYPTLKPHMFQRFHNFYDSIMHAFSSAWRSGFNKRFMHRSRYGVVKSVLKSEKNTKLIAEKINKLDKKLDQSTVDKLDKKLDNAKPLQKHRRHVKNFFRLWRGFRGYHRQAPDFYRTEYYDLSIRMFEIARQIRELNVSWWKFWDKQRDALVQEYSKLNRRRMLISRRRSINARFFLSYHFRRPFSYFNKDTNSIMTVRKRYKRLARNSRILNYMTNVELIRKNLMPFRSSLQPYLNYTRYSRRLAKHQARNVFKRRSFWQKYDNMVYYSKLELSRKYLAKKNNLFGLYKMKVLQSLNSFVGKLPISELTRKRIRNSYFFTRVVSPVNKIQQIYNSYNIKLGGRKLKFKKFQLAKSPLERWYHRRYRTSRWMKHFVTVTLPRRIHNLWYPQHFTTDMRLRAKQARFLRPAFILPNDAIVGEQADRLKGLSWRYKFFFSPKEHGALGKYIEYVRLRSGGPDLKYWASEFRSQAIYRSRMQTLTNAIGYRTMISSENIKPEKVNFVEFVRRQIDLGVPTIRVSLDPRNLISDRYDIPSRLKEARISYPVAPNSDFSNIFTFMLQRYPNKGVASALGRNWPYETYPFQNIPVLTEPLLRTATEFQEYAEAVQTLVGHHRLQGAYKPYSVVDLLNPMEDLLGSRKPHSIIVDLGPVMNDPDLRPVAFLQSPPMTYWDKKELESVIKHSRIFYLSKLHGWSVVTNTELPLHLITERNKNFEPTFMNQAADVLAPEAMLPALDALISYEDSVRAALREKEYELNIIRNDLIKFSNYRKTSFLQSNFLRILKDIRIHGDQRFSDKVNQVAWKIASKVYGTRRPSNKQLSTILLDKALIGELYKQIGRKHASIWFNYEQAMQKLQAERLRFDYYLNLDNPFKLLRDMAQGWHMRRRPGLLYRQNHNFLMEELLNKYWTTDKVVAGKSKFEQQIGSEALEMLMINHGLRNLVPSVHEPSEYAQWHLDLLGLGNYELPESSTDQKPVSLVDFHDKEFVENFENQLESQALEELDFAENPDSYFSAVVDDVQRQLQTRIEASLEQSLDLSSGDRISPSAFERMLLDAAPTNEVSATPSDVEISALRNRAEDEIAAPAIHDFTIRYEQARLDTITQLNRIRDFETARFKNSLQHLSMVRSSQDSEILKRHLQRFYDIYSVRWYHQRFDAFERQWIKEEKKFLLDLTVEVNKRHRRMIDTVRTHNSLPPLTDDQYACLCLLEKPSELSVELQNEFKTRANEIFAEAERARQLQHANDFKARVKAAFEENLKRVKTDTASMNLQEEAAKTADTVTEFFSQNEYYAAKRKELTGEIDKAVQYGDFEAYYKTFRLRSSYDYMNSVLPKDTPKDEIDASAVRHAQRQNDRERELMDKTVYTDEERAELTRIETKRRRLRAVFDSTIRRLK